MKYRYKYATTSVDLYETSDSIRRNNYKNDEDIAPRAPGKEWEMCGSAASDDRVYWFWRKITK